MPKWCVQPSTRILGGEFEYSIHVVPPMTRRELVQILPQQKTSLLDRSQPSSSSSTAETADVPNWYAIPTFQRCPCDMTQYNAETERVKNELLARFMNWADMLRLHILNHGHACFCDAIDPVTGFPAHEPHGQTVYSEVDGAELLCKYAVDAAAVAGCRLLVHPVWLTAVYPATVFCMAPLTAIHAAIQHANSILGEDKSRPMSTTASAAD